MTTATAGGGAETSAVVEGLTTLCGEALEAADGLLAGGAVDALPLIGGPVLLLSGSCSVATNAQVARWEADGGATLRLDPLALAEGTQSAAKAVSALVRPTVVKVTSSWEPIFSQSE